MNRDGTRELPIRIREPADEPSGALVLLHGRAVDQDDLVPLLEVLDPDRRLLGLCPGGPITGIPPGGRHWYVVERVGYPEHRTFHDTLSQLESVLDTLLEERGIGWGSTLLGGFSQGAVMAYALGLSDGRPRPAGILALSGFIPTVEGWSPSPQPASGLPMFLSHGSADPIIPVEFARQARAALESLGAELEYRETPMGHAIDPRMLEELRAWVAERVD